jgi:ferredoxin
LARLDRNVQLADLLRAEAQGQAAGDERSAAFHAGGGREAGLFSAADDTVRRLRRGAALVGAWCGLVVGLTLIGAVARRRQEDYVADAGRCFACGRCFRWCPRERLRRGEITADALPAPSDPGAG